MPSLNEWANSQEYNNILAGRYTDTGIVKNLLCPNPNCAKPALPNIMFSGKCGTPLKPVQKKSSKANG